MIQKKSMIDRRKHPRLANNIPVKICQEDGDVVTETANISRSGAYCRVERYIEPMSKMKIHLLLPIKRGGKSSTKKISCEGVVVRTESIPNQNAYHVAIFFSDISSRDSESIADYVSNYLQQAEKTVKI